MITELQLLDVTLDQPQAQQLIAELQQEYLERYGGRDQTPMTSAEFEPPPGAFVIALADGEPAGCAGIRCHDDETAELKRLYVRTSHRRLGLASLLLLTVEDRARKLGYRRMILETGLKQPEAISLYQARGYSPTATYGIHSGSPHSRSFIKTL
jgi:GNAT superfamily N-acetyltransferase